MSLLVHCESQAKVDALWEKLSEGGETGRCGWLIDRFGVSWQVKPTALLRMLQDEDEAKAERVTRAMLAMNKTGADERGRGLLTIHRYTRCRQE
jgi:predicted 3-demethylubiquinone-9 3-methyltransferase (glyoxalase superfamily)